jgi:hypothetical protein
MIKWWLSVLMLLSLPSHAGLLDESASDASGMVAIGALSAVAAPVLITGGVVGLAGQGAVGASAVAGSAAGAASTVAASAALGVVRLVSETGGGLSELTGDALSAVNESVIENTPTVRVVVEGPNRRVAPRDIPLVVRKDYVQMNEPLR